MSIQMSLQRIAAVAAEVRSLRHVDEPAPEAFSAALGRAAQTGAAPAGGAVAAFASALPQAGQAGAWTLGAMLGGRGGLGALAAAALPVGMPAAASAALGPLAALGHLAVAGSQPVAAAAAPAGQLPRPAVW